VEAFKPLPIIWYVDGKPIERHTIQTGLVGPVDVEVLPGRHSVQLGFYQRKVGPPTIPTASLYSGKDSYVIDVYAEAGHTYEARVRVLSENMSGASWEAEIVDLQSGKRFVPNEAASGLSEAGTCYTNYTWPPPYTAEVMAKQTREKFLTDVGECERDSGETQNVGTASCFGHDKFKACMKKKGYGTTGGP
jgi:hypothetical protein